MTITDSDLNILFVGNPGAGKSTLLNCLMKSKDPNAGNLFRSGVSIGEGLTYKFDQNTIGNVTYMDTPGLEDTKRREQAAKAISAALKQSGNYQVVFVVTLESGRVRPQDVTVINLVLESAPEISRYGVIFNKLTKGVLREISDNPTNKNKLLVQASLETKSDRKDRPVPMPLFLNKYEALEDENDVTISMPKLEEFMSIVPIIHIHQEKVKDIEIDKFERYSKQLEGQLKELKKNTEEMTKKMEADRKEYERRTREIMEEEKQRHAAEMKRISEENAKQMKVLQDQEKARMQQMDKMRHEDAEKHQQQIALMREESKKQQEILQEQHREQQEQQKEMMDQMDERHQKELDYQREQAESGICVIL